MPNRPRNFCFLLVLVFFSCQVQAGKDKKLSVTALAGFPHPVNLGFDYRFADKWSGGVTGGYLALGLNYSSTGKFNIDTRNVEARFRFHPFSQSFFIGIAGGYQEVSGDTDRNITISSLSVAAKATAQIKNYYVIPHLGWFRVSQNGFTWGLEVGAYIPLNTKSTVNVTSSDPLVAQASGTPEYRQLQGDAQRFADQVGGWTLPFLTAVRLGWTF